MSMKAVLWRPMYDPGGHDLLRAAGIEPVIVDSPDAEQVKASSGGVQVGDWIQEIDNTEITSFAQARQVLSAIESDKDRNEAVFLVERNNETKVLRIKLK